jgi:L-amino acid N-acyltransferase YncA
MKIRAYRSEDAPQIWAIYEPVVANSIATFEYEIPELTIFLQRLAAIAGRFPFLVAEDDAGNILGYAYGSSHRERVAYQWAVETSVYVKDSGKGVGRALYKALLPQLTDRGFVWAYGVITQPNPASVALHEASGYVGFATYKDAGQKFGEWHDVFWMRKMLNHPKSKQSAPIFKPAVDPNP